MQYQIPLPQNFPTTSIKALLEDHWLIPRKVRHFLRTKKHVLVNQEVINWQSTVQAGDIITLTFDETDYPDKPILMGDPKQVQPLYEDDHLIIVNKPEGLKTHANAPQELALLNHVSAYVGATCYVVHRLDMETSGAILFAKNPFILPILNRLLEARAISRTYLALVSGTFSKNKLRYTDKIGRHRHDRRKRVVDPRGGQTAVTQVRVQQSQKQVSLVSCQLETGRTHQIRVHLAHHGHALIGDPLYSQVSAPRLMLHAQTLTFTHPLTLAPIQVTASSPSFQALLDHYLPAQGK